MTIFDLDREMAALLAVPGVRGVDLCSRPFDELLRWRCTVIVAQQTGASGLAVWGNLDEVARTPSEALIAGRDAALRHLGIREEVAPL